VAETALASVAEHASFKRRCGGSCTTASSTAEMMSERTRNDGILFSYDGGKTRSARQRTSRVGKDFTATPRTSFHSLRDAVKAASGFVSPPGRLFLRHDKTRYDCKNPRWKTGVPFSLSGAFVATRRERGATKTVMATQFRRR